MGKQQREIKLDGVKLPPAAVSDGILDLPRFKIRSLTFSKDPPDIPGRNTSSVTHRDFIENGRHTVEYIPQIRHYLITFYNKSTGNEDRVIVHETKPSKVTLP